MYFHVKVMICIFVLFVDILKLRRTLSVGMRLFKKFAGLHVTCLLVGR